jgi:hypothetical protein
MVSLLTWILFLRQLPGFKEFFYIGILIASLSMYYLMGRENIKPDPMDFTSGMKTVATILVVTVPLFYASRPLAIKAIEALIWGVVFCVILTVVYTIVTQPVLLSLRMSVFPITGDQLYTPGLANSLAIAVFLLAFFFRRDIWLYLLAILFITALVLANRTALVLCLFYLLFGSVQNLRRLGAPTTHNIMVLGTAIVIGVSFLFAHLDLLVVSFDLFYERLTNERFETGRWKNQADGFEALFSGVLPMGGYEVTQDATLWFHNIFLDAYRVAGIASAIAFLILFAIPLKMILRNFDVRLLCAWLCGTAIACTSVPLESSKFDWYSVFFAISLVFFIKNNREPIARKNVLSARKYALLAVKRITQ